MNGETERPATRAGGAPPPAALPLTQDFNAGSLYALRSAVAAHAASAGLSRHRVYDITAVVHELAANAVLHGAGHGSLRLWTEDAYLFCAVADDGPAGNGDAPVGGAQVPQADGAVWPVVHGHGLWLVAEIADDVRVDRGHAGTIITARFAIYPDKDGH